MATVPIFVMPHDKTSLAKSIFEQYLFFSFVIFCIINYFLVFFSDWCWVFFKFALIYWTMICESILVDIMGLSKSVKRENQFSDACFQQILGFADFFFLIFYFIVSFTADYPQSHGLCCQGYDNHMIQQQNRIGQWVCSVICVGVCDCDESLLKLECLVLGNFLMRLSRIWEKIPEEKNKMLYYATYCFVVFTMSNQLGTKCFNLIYWWEEEKKGNHN